MEYTSSKFCLIFKRWHGKRCYFLTREDFRSITLHTVRKNIQSRKKGWSTGVQDQSKSERKSVATTCAGGSACGLEMGSRLGRQAGRKKGTFICGFSGMMVSLPVDIDSPWFSPVLVFHHLRKTIYTKFYKDLNFAKLSTL